MASKCTKAYTVTSNNPKMSGSVKPKSYMGGGMIKSYQKGGLVTPNRPNNRPKAQQTPPPPPKGMSREEMQRRVAEKSKATAATREAAMVREQRYKEMERKTNEAYKRATGRD